MSAIGSVFLGDVQRQRVISSSTPPSSPPPHLGANAPHSFADVDVDESAAPAQRPGPLATPAPPSIDPALALELRIRWLETLLFGAKHDAGDHAAKGGARPEKVKEGETLTRRAEDLQRRMDGIAQSNDSLKRFMDRCELPASAIHPPSKVNVSVTCTSTPYPSETFHVDFLAPHSGECEYGSGGNGVHLSFPIASSQLRRSMHRPIVETI